MCLVLKKILQNYNNLGNINNNIHIYWINLDQEKNILNSIYNNLSSVDKNVVSKYREGNVRNRKIISTGVLANLLSQYLELLPDEIILSKNRYGKPFVSPIVDSELNFNLSHSDNIGIFAFTTKYQIGIDIEKIKDIDNIDEIMRLVFTPNEISLFKNLSIETKTDLFYRLWTAKEAFMKAIGRGFSFSPKKIEFSFDNFGKIFINKIFDKKYKPEEFKIYAFYPTNNSVSTIIYEKNNFEVKKSKLNLLNSSELLYAE